MRHLAVLLCFATAAARTWVTFSDRSRPLWRTSLTLAVSLISLCALFRYELSAFIDGLSPNITEALSYSLLIASVGMANVYLDALVSPAPSWRDSRHHIFVSLALVVTILVSWWQIPHVHEANVHPGVNRLPMSPPLLIFNFAAFGALLPAGTRVLLFCRQKIRSNREAEHPEPGAYVGLTLIWTFSLVGMAGCLEVCVMSVVRLFQQEPLAPDSFHLAFPPIANAVCLSGLTSGVIVLLLGPRWQEWRETRHLDKIVTPLWATLVRQHPQVVLAGRQNVTRRLIEVHDALAIHHIPADDCRDLSRIAAAIRRGDQGDVLVGKALSEIDPSDMAVIRLAAAYNEGSNHACHSKAPTGYVASTSR